MIYHFSFVNEVKTHQSFVLPKSSQSLLIHWKEIHKRSRKKKSFFYLSKLKKKKKLFCQRKALNLSLADATKKIEVKFSFVFKAHQNLFLKHLKTYQPTFFDAGISKPWTSRRHIGYTVDGDVLWKHSKKFSLPQYKKV